MNNSLTQASGQVKVREYSGFGGDKFDSKHISTLFNYEAPHRFDTYITKLYSSSDRFKNNMFSGMTVAKGAYKEIMQDRYTWMVEDDDEKAFTIMEFLEAGNAGIGWNGSTFQFVLDENWMHEPDVIVGTDNNFPIEIVGNPVPHAASGYWLYTGRLQDTDPEATLPADQLQVGSIFRKQSTSVGTSNNHIFGTTQFGSFMELECQIGQYAEHVILEDKLIRQEKIMREQKGQADQFGSGYYIPFQGKKSLVTDSGKDKGKEIRKGMFIMAAENQVMKQIEHDREWACLYGKAGSRKDYTGRTIKRTAPGLRQLTNDGHLFYHNGAITAQELKDFIMDIYFSREDEMMRKVTFDTGTGGSDLFHILLANEANSFLTVDTNFIKSAGGADPRHLSYGARFVHFYAGNGVQIDLVLNPWKDSIRYCGRTHPDNPHIPIDSYRMDVWDFGQSGSEQNITMLMQKGTSYYAIICSLIDPYGHYVANGSKVSNGSKNVEFQRELSGSPFVRDTSRIGAVIYDPAYISA